MRSLRSCTIARAGLPVGVGMDARMRLISALRVFASSREVRIFRSSLSIARIPLRSLRALREVPLRTHKRRTRVKHQQNVGLTREVSIYSVVGLPAFNPVSGRSGIPQLRIIMPSSLAFVKSSRSCMRCAVTPRTLPRGKHRARPRPRYTVPQFLFH